MNTLVVNGLGRCPHEEMLRQQMVMMRWPQNDGNEVMARDAMYQQQVARLGAHRPTGRPAYDPSLAEQDKWLAYEIPAHISEQDWVKQQLTAECYPDSDAEGDEPTPQEIIAYFETAEQQRNIEAMQLRLEVASEFKPGQVKPA